MSKLGLWMACLVALSAGCDAAPAEGPVGLDGGALFDGGKADGSGPPGPDADAGSMTSDAGSMTFDASSMDGGTTPMDAGVGCMVGGQSGVCLPTAACDGVSTPGFCPGDVDIQCCTPRTDAGMGGMCDPAAMPLPNVGLTEAPGTGGCPAGMVRLSTFCVDRYEASLVLADGSGEWSPYHNPGATRVRAVSVAGAVPQGYINADQAAAACAEAGKRLCTDTEWLAACRGAAGRVFPYGAARMAGVCNDARSPHPVIERFGTSADWIWSMLGDACINQLPASLATTGAHAGCVTPEGLFDMMGNLHEWTSASGGTFRGGYYVDTYRNGDGCLYRTTAHNRSHWDYSTGFRCCAD